MTCRIIWILMLAVITSSLQAQHALTLQECYQHAIEANLTLKQVRNQSDIARSELKNARFNRLPSLDYAMDHSLSTGKNIDPVSNTFIRDNFSGGFMGLGAELKIFSGFNTLYNVKYSKSNMLSADMARRSAELEVMNRVTVAFARLMYYKEQSFFVRSNLLKTKKELDITVEKVKLGRLGNNELFLLNARLSNEEAEISGLVNDSLAAVQQLRQLLNIPYSKDLDIRLTDTSALGNIAQRQISRDALLEKVRAKHPAIVQARTAEESARLRKKIAQSLMFPSISVGGNVVSNYNMSDRYSNGAKIGLSDQLNNNLGKNLYISLQIPLFSHANYATAVKRESILRENAGYLRNETENEIITGALQLINDFQTSRDNYRSTHRAWDNMKLSYAIYEEKYRLGQVSSMELITAKDMLNMATSRYLNAKFDLMFRHQLLMLLDQSL